jgi:hypothetical protein
MIAQQAVRMGLKPPKPVEEAPAEPPVATLPEAAPNSWLTHLRKKHTFTTPEGRIAFDEQAASQDLSEMVDANLQQGREVSVKHGDKPFRITEVKNRRLYDESGQEHGLLPIVHGEVQLEIAAEKSMGLKPPTVPQEAPVAEKPPEPTPTPITQPEAPQKPTEREGEGSQVEPIASGQATFFKDTSSGGRGQVGVQFPDVPPQHVVDALTNVLNSQEPKLKQALDLWSQNRLKRSSKSGANE